MLSNIFCLLIGAWFGFFVACVLAASKRHSAADFELDEPAPGERYDHIWG